MRIGRRLARGWQKLCAHRAGLTSHHFKYASHVGDAQRLSPDEQIRLAREAFDAGDDFTIAVEEEFALLDPDTLELTNRFEELKAGAAGTELDELLRLPAETRAALGSAARQAAVERWSWSSVAARLLEPFQGG